MQILPDDHSRLGAFVNFGPPFCFHVLVVMFFAAQSGTAPSFLNSLKEFVSPVHALELGVSNDTTGFCLLRIGFHLLEYLLGLDLGLVDLLLILLLILWLFVDHGFKLLLDLKLVRHL